jgi:hypothetical protein
MWGEKVAWGRAVRSRLRRLTFHFSKVLYVVALHSKYTRTLTFEICGRPCNANSRWGALWATNSETSSL